MKMRGRRRRWQKAHPTAAVATVWHAGLRPARKQPRFQAIERALKFTPQ
jgi:hypothetical protein